MDSSSRASRDCAEQNLVAYEVPPRDVADTQEAGPRLSGGSRSSKPAAIAEPAPQYGATYTPTSRLACLDPFGCVSVKPRHLHVFNRTSIDIYVELHAVGGPQVGPAKETSSGSAEAGSKGVKGAGSSSTEHRYGDASTANTKIKIMARCDQEVYLHDPDFTQIEFKDSKMNVFYGPDFVNPRSVWTVAELKCLSRVTCLDDYVYVRGIVYPPPDSCLHCSCDICDKYPLAAEGKMPDRSRRWGPEWAQVQCTNMACTCEKADHAAAKQQQSGPGTSPPPFWGPRLVADWRA